MKRFLILIIVSLSVFTAAAQQKTVKKMENKITAIELYNAFRTKHAEAVKSYNEKKMLISGVASFVGPDPFALPSVELTDKEGNKSKVLCVLPFSDYLKLRKVSKKDKVVIQGIVKDYAEKYDYIVVKECKIIEVNGKKL